MKDKQELFTKSSKLYLSLQNRILELATYKNESEENKKELLQSFDALLSIMMLYVAAFDLNVYDIELKFIDLITIEKDILKEYNLSHGTNYNWKNINKIFSISDFNKFVDELYDFSKENIQILILFLANVDSLTSKDEYKYIEEKLKELMYNFMLVDGQTSDDEKAFVNYIVQKLFLSKYDSIKQLFLKTKISINI